MWIYEGGYGSSKISALDWLYVLYSWKRSSTNRGSTKIRALPWAPPSSALTGVVRISLRNERPDGLGTQNDTDGKRLRDKGLSSPCRPETRWPSLSSEPTRRCSTSTKYAQACAQLYMLSTTSRSGMDPYSNYYGPQNAKKVGEKQAEPLIDLDTEIILGVERDLRIP